MHRLIPLVLIAAVIVLVAALGAKFWLEPGKQDSTTAGSSDTVTPQPAPSLYIRTVTFPEPVQVSTLPDNLYGMICRIGHPILVSSTSSGFDQRFVFFEGRFLIGEDEQPKRYFYHTIEHLGAEKGTGYIAVDDLEPYRSKADPHTLKRLQIPLLKATPDTPEKLRSLLGNWTSEYEKEGKQRLVYDQKMCIGEQLVYGAYFDIQAGKVVSAKGLTSAKKVYAQVNNVQASRQITTSQPDAKPIRYTDEAPEEGTAEQQLIELIIAREKGDRETALTMVSKEVTSDFIRDTLVRSTDSDSPVRLGSLSYQVLEVGSGHVDIEVSYHVQNGSSFRSKHRMVLEDNQWKALF